MRRKQSFGWTHLFPEYRCFHHRPAIELYYACYRNVRKSDDVTARAFLAWQFSLWPNVPFRVPFLFLFASIAANDKKIDWKFNKYNYLPLNLKIETVVLFSVFFLFNCFDRLPKCICLHLTGSIDWMFSSPLALAAVGASIVQSIPWDVLVGSFPICCALPVFRPYEWTHYVVYHWFHAISQYMGVRLQFKCVGDNELMKHG